jgi:L,D-transpeptidase catalytic domain
MKILLVILAGFALLQAPPSISATGKAPPKHTSTLGTPRTVVPTKLKPGEYLWVPEVSPRGPIVVVVSLPEQLAYVYRNGVIIGASTISTGKKGHRTPTGVFTILQKNEDHYSNLYNAAPMPYMQRLTWSGIAIHAGHLPGYPASHGCVRMPYEFARKLFAETKTGLTVVVSDEKLFPDNVAHPGLVAPVNVSGAPVSGPSLVNGLAWQPEAASEGPVTILLTNEDQRIRVFRNGIEIGHASFTLMDPHRKITLHVLTRLELSGTEPPDPATGRPMPRWLEVSGKEENTVSTGELLAVFNIPSEFLNELATVVEPGTTLVITQPAASASTRTTLTNDVVAISADSPARH